jgi:hypothetical protein
MIKFKYPNDAQLTKELKKAVEEKKRQGFKALPQGEMFRLGDAFKDAMTSTIEKGQSPITPWPSRFPAYKYSSAPQDERANKYPFSARKSFPSKRARPVNLTLSGEFLKSLKVRPIKRGDNNYLNVGFDNFESELKELGHREGVNGQPKRPIVPSEIGEDFIRPLRRFLETAFEVILRNVLARTK